MLSNLLKIKYLNMDGQYCRDDSWYFDKNTMRFLIDNHQKWGYRVLTGKDKYQNKSVW